MLGATVLIIEKPTMGGVTDLEGKYAIINVPQGTYSLKVTSMGYDDKIINNVHVYENITTDIDVKYDTAQQSDVMGELVIKGVRETSSEESVILEVKETQSVVNAIGAEQISKSQDRDAAQVMQRIPGVTIVDNRFVMVRGLNQRYNVVMLNGIVAPSTESDSRAFSFDMIPSALLDRLLVFKSGSPELPGDVGGAVIKVNTKNISDENFQKLTFGTGLRPGTTFKTHMWNPGSKTDWLGYDNGLRALPDNFPAHLNNISFNNSAQENAAKSLNNNWSLKEKNVIPDLRFSYTLAKKFGTGNFKANNITSINYSNTWQYLSIRNQRHQTILDSTTNTYTQLYKFNDEKLNNNVRIGLLHNWSATLGHNHFFTFRNMFNQMGFSETTLRSGQDFRGSSQGYDVFSRALYYQSRGIYSGQLEGKHEFASDRTVLTWILGYSNINSKEPDFRRGGYLKPSDSDEDSTVYIPGVATDNDAARYFSDLHENTKTFSVGLEQFLTKKRKRK